MLIDFLPYIAEGVLVTLQISFFSLILTIVAGFALALCRMASNPVVRWPATMVVEIFRGTSAIVQLFWAFYVLPFLGIELSPLVSAVVVLGLNEGSYFSEVVRGAIVGVPKTQKESALALGYSPVSRFLRVILPQALILMIPPGTNVVISLVKFSSLASLVTVTDLTYRALAVRSNIGQTTELFTLILLIYFAISMAISLTMRGVENSVVTRLGIGNVSSRKPSMIRLRKRMS